MRVATQKSLTEFFRERILEAQNHQQIVLLEETQFYIVNLLAQACNPKDLGEPLAQTFCRAFMAEKDDDRFHLFREIGDRSLYVSGFFADSLQRKAVDLNYYIRMGALAYHLLSGLVEEINSCRLAPDTFAELSEKFGKLVDLLAEVSESAELTSDRDLLRLYERWLETKSDRLYHKLKQGGILPVDLDKDKMH